MGRMCCFNTFDFFLNKNFVFWLRRKPFFFVYLRRNSSKDRELIPPEISGGGVIRLLSSNYIIIKLKVLTKNQKR